ncbi:MAG: MFS transporter [Planctomyces sp.]
MTETESGFNRAQRLSVLAAGFAAWMFAGLENALFVLIHRQMMLSLLPPGTPETVITEWFAWNQAAFMLGAATGGWIFGLMGDRIGRTRALGASVLCYSLLTLAAWWITDPVVMCSVRFLAMLGFGGTWPNAVSLVTEAWPGASRPLLAGVMGTAANFGFVLLGCLGLIFEVTPDSWRWTLFVGGAPAALGLAILLAVPESRRWLTQKHAARNFGDSSQATTPQQSVTGQLFRPPLLSRTLIGILLGSIPVIGTAANANWVVPWRDQAAARQAEQTAATAARNGTPASLQKKKNGQSPRDKARTMISRSSGAVFGSLLGGLIATFAGRRLSYFLISLATFAVSSTLFGLMQPSDPWFDWAVFLLGFCGVAYFGWLPLFLPELFPVHVRATGSGISFNAGRIAAAAVSVFVGLRMRAFGGDYSAIGLWTGLIYAVGMLVIWLAPAEQATAKK